MIKIRFFSRNVLQKYLRKNGIFLFLLLLLLAAVHAEGKAAVSSCFMEQILQPTPSLLTSSTSPSSLHCPFNQLPSPPSSSSMILFALPRPYFPSPHMLVATQLFFSLWSCLSFFPSSRGQTSPTNPSTCKSARLAKISNLDGEIYDPENVEQKEKGIEVEYEDSLPEGDIFSDKANKIENSK